MVTVWTPQAITELRKAYDYISKDSTQNARKVVEDLTAIADRLPAQPELFPQINSRKIMMATGGHLKNITIASLIE